MSKEKYKRVTGNYSTTFIRNISAIQLLKQTLTINQDFEIMININIEKTVC